MTLLTCLALSVLIQLLFFIIAIAKKTDKVTDLAYGVGFVSLSGAALAADSTYTWSKVVIFGMILLWALRLSTYLLIRIFAMGRDKRFDGVREYAQKFIKFFLFQGLAVWLISLSSLVTITAASDISNTRFISIIGILTFLSGLTIESFADYQKFQFKKNSKNKDNWIETGLWKYARHPNYYGEMLVWWGIWIFSLSIIPNLWAITILSPLTITSILLFFSGIPPLEKRYNVKYKGNKEYEKYKKSTRLLIPLPK